MLPALGDDFDRPLDAGLSELGIVLTPAQRAAITAQARLLVAWGSAINLTALRAADAIAVEHVLDSLSGVAALRAAIGDPQGATLLDLGSGAGYPGLPLAITLPLERVALVEPIGKKARFLGVAAAAVIAELAATRSTPRGGIEVSTARAEELGHDRTHRGRWTVVVARAVAPMAVLVELSLPLVARGGCLIAWKRDDGAGSLEREIAAATVAIELAGGGLPRVHTVRVSGLHDHRLVVVPKLRASLDRLPRSPAERRRPLVR